ncbi:MAG: 23S rRNA (adenine(2030)-N(6))-methyltransferase RlmJ [Amphiplicatus sp.]
MNYRHLYHAGNFADVVKHAVLALCLDHLRAKPAPFRVIDTHAGRGRYDLAGVEAGKTLEWTDGIGRLAGVDAAPLPEAIAEILAPYLAVIHAENPAQLSIYPGSPALARAMLRGQDRLVVNELHPADHAALSTQFARDAQVKVLALDGWTALKALLPPKERRGLVLIDPPFERRDDFNSLARSLREAAGRFATGVFILWHPIKDGALAAAFYEAARRAGFEKTLRVEFRVHAKRAGLGACGLFIVNPPWTLRAKLEILGPFLAERLAQGEAYFRID